jgi:hypothetical protein
MTAWRDQVALVISQAALEASAEQRRGCWRNAARQFA